MKRYAEDSALLIRRANQRKALSSSGTAEVERGRFRKRKPFDCGRSRCRLCHGEKLSGRPSFARVRADVAAAHDFADWQQS